MTDNPDLQGVIDATRAILLDFDGPVTHLFVEGRNGMVADRMRSVLPGNVDVPPELRDTPDPLIILRWSATHLSSAAAADVERACEAGELLAALASIPTPGCAELLTATKDLALPVVIVSNNTEGAIRAFLDLHQLSFGIDAVVGRTPGQPGLMKPHPSSIQRALNRLGLPPGACTMIGDSVSDIDVSIATGVRSIGFAKNAHRGRELRSAGANAIAVTMSEIAESLVASRPAARRTSPNL